MPRTPLEIMIDRACGIPDSEASATTPLLALVDRAKGIPTHPDSILLHCIACGRRKQARRDPTDPPGTAVVQARCPECVGGDFDEVLYFDASGKHIIGK